MKTPKIKTKYIASFIASAIVIFSSAAFYISNIKSENTTDDIYTVVYVTDGDTIKVEDKNKNQFTVRYLYVDTPETVKPNTPVQCYGKEASDYNKSIVSNKKVRLEKDVEDKDIYDRLLRYVYLDLNNDGKYDDMVNNILLEKGYAKIYHSSVKQKNVKYEELFIKTEKIASDKKVGLWGSCTANSANVTTNISPVVTVVADPSLGLETESADCKIKGNINSSGDKIYHMVGQKYYNSTIVEPEKGERWFCNEQDAQKQGYRKSKI
ncbi:MAG: thermonuclease family protein [bacterium]